jgi:hypothetical protein
VLLFREHHRGFVALGTQRRGGKKAGIDPTIAARAFSQQSSANATRTRYRPRYYRHLCTDGFEIRCDDDVSKSHPRLSPDVFGRCLEYLDFHGLLANSLKKLTNLIVERPII